MPITLAYMSELEELFELAETYPERLSEWEKNFLASIKKGVKSYRLDYDPSVAQRAKIEQCMEKVYQL